MESLKLNVRLYHLTVSIKIQNVQAGSKMHTSILTMVNLKSPHK